MSSMIRTIRRRAERVGHYGRGGRGHLQAQDKQDVVEFQKQVNTRLKHIQPVKHQTIDNTSALKHRREPRVVIPDRSEVNGKASKPNTKRNSTKVRS